MLTNGPGDPTQVEIAVDTIKNLLGWRPIFGICMGHQLLSLALGAQTFKIKFGHRGGNHPVKDIRSNKVYVTSQNHGYAVQSDSLPEGVEVTHINLNDQTVEGIRHLDKKCFSVQFHPESHPGPNDALALFDEFLGMLQ
jgi:carbamoyl-phosphate synthase small subunit